MPRGMEWKVKQDTKGFYIDVRINNLDDWERQKYYSYFSDAMDELKRQVTKEKEIEKRIEEADQLRMIE